MTLPVNMSAAKEADEAVTSSSDHGYGSTRSVRWLDRIKGQNIDLNEVGKEYFQQSLQYDEAQLERDSVKVCRKLDFYVLPMVRPHPFLQSNKTLAWLTIPVIDDDDLHVELPRQTDVRHLHPMGELGIDTYFLSTG